MKTKKSWPVQDAKARFSEVLRAAAKEPQRISYRGQDTAVLLSAAEFDRLTSKKGVKRRSLADVLRDCPRAPEFELPPRGFEPMRRVDFS
ncbi:MAG: type II toxin-antitoxin system Phd/YefM family antitoxin [Proteobacteria bacterium]|nr:type II toxin-antitoxin system Phd/YefM family antitoxin [Pseudomonadota bacterium]